MFGILTFIFNDVVAIISYIVKSDFINFLNYNF
jgi:hypothetical protein